MTLFEAIHPHRPSDCPNVREAWLDIQNAELPGIQKTYTCSVTGQPITEKECKECDFVKDSQMGNNDICEMKKKSEAAKEKMEKCPNFVCSKREPFYDGADGINYICGVTGEQINQYDCEECEMLKDREQMKQHERIMRESVENIAKQEQNLLKPDDAVNAPAHYSGQIECIDYLRDKLTPEEFIGFCMGNVLKYASRWRKKDGVQDLEKAGVYLRWATERAKES